MTLAAVLSSSAIPVTQNTAPVKEFRCLYTHDLRRKAKRWQDGFLRYHTFNRRIMVYDVARNFIGDTYNRSGVDLQDGDELDLEKDFALVQVSEPLGVTQTDLTELMQSRHKKDPPTPATSRRQHGVSHTTQPSLAAIQIPRTTATKRPANTAPSIQEPSAPSDRHRSLSALLGPSKGPLGKAVLTTLSPFEERQKRLAEEVHGAKRSSKKPKKSTAEKRRNSTFSQSPLQVDVSPAVRRPTTTPSHSKHVIDLCSEEDSPGLFSSIVRTRKDLGFGAIIPAKQTEQENPVQSPTAGKTSATATQSRFFSSAEDEEPVEARKTLRVISNVPRKMLLCQQPPPRKRTASPALNLGPKEADSASRPSKGKPQAVQSGLSKAPTTKVQTASPVADLSPPATLDPTPISPPQPPVERRAPSVPLDVVPAGRANDLPIAASNPRADTSIKTRCVAPSAGLRTAPPHQKTARSTNRTFPTERVDLQPAAPPAPAPKPMSPLDFGPWSREAQDLFDWWPPDRDRAGNRLAAAT